MKHSIELYQLADDPAAAHEISAENPEVTRRLRRLLIDWLLDAEDVGWSVTQDSVAVAEIEQLAALGYTQDASAGQANEWFDPDCDCKHCRLWED